MAMITTIRALRLNADGTCVPTELYLAERLYSDRMAAEREYDVDALEEVARTQILGWGEMDGPATEFRHPAGPRYLVGPSIWADLTN